MGKEAIVFSAWTSIIHKICSLLRSLLDSVNNWKGGLVQKTCTDAGVIWSIYTILLVPSWGTISTSHSVSFMIKTCPVVESLTGRYDHSCSTTAVPYWKSRWAWDGSLPWWKGPHGLRRQPGTMFNPIYPSLLPITITKEMQFFGGCSPPEPPSQPQHISLFLLLENKESPFASKRCCLDQQKSEKSKQLVEVY